MKHNFRFFVAKVEGDKTSLDDKELVRRISKVLRFKEGDTFTAFDNTGYEYTARIDRIGKKSIECSVVKKELKEQNYKVNVYASLIKKNRFEFLVEKLTEAGIRSITPIVTKHTEVKNINLERLKLVSRDAAEQSGKTRLPTIGEPIKLKEAVERTRSELNIVLYRSDFSREVFEMEEKIKHANNVNIFVGPEGDFSDEEIAEFKKNGFVFMSLGDQNLRSETAAIVGAYLISTFSK